MTSSQQDKGIVYILSNPSMPSIYKIGMTRGSLAARIITLRSTSLPVDFKEVLFFESGNALQLEKFIHRNLKTNRVSSDREFFSFLNDEMVINAVEPLVRVFKPREYTDKEKKSLPVKNGANTPSQQAKAAGLKNLTQVIEVSGWPRSTLVDMARNHPKRFRIVLLGCLADINAY